MREGGREGKKGEGQGHLVRTEGGREGGRANTYQGEAGVDLI